MLIATESNGIGLTIFSQALPPDEPSTVGTARVLAASLILGLGLAAALAYFLASRRRAFGSRLLPELVLNAPLLAEVPNFALEGIKSPLPVTSAPTSASAEAFRFAAAAVDIRAAAAGARSLMMVSATLGSGKTTTAANTAIAAAREGLNVLIIDADFGNQEVTRLLLGDLQPEFGITEVVAGTVRRSSTRCQEVVVTENRSLHVLWRGRQPVEASTFFRSDEAQQFFQDVRDQFDLVLIDGPPLLQVAYASTLVRYVDGVAVIVPHNSRVGELEEVADRLHFIETPAIGYIYTKAPLRAEMTASDGSMKDILGLGFESESEAPSSGSKRSDSRAAKKAAAAAEKASPAAEETKATSKASVGTPPRTGRPAGGTTSGPRKVRRPSDPRDSRDARGTRVDSPSDASKAGSSKAGSSAPGSSSSTRRGTGSGPATGPTSSGSGESGSGSRFGAGRNRGSSGGPGTTGRASGSGDGGGGSGDGGSRNKDGTASPSSRTSGGSSGGSDSASKGSSSASSSGSSDSASKGSSSGNSSSGSSSRTPSGGSSRSRGSTEKTPPATGKTPPRTPPPRRKDPKKKS